MQLASSYPTLISPADRMFRNSWGWGKQAGVAAETLCSAFPLPHTSPLPVVNHCSTRSKVNNHSSFLSIVLYRLQNMSTHLPTFAYPNLMWAGDTLRVAVRIYPSLLRSTPMLLGKIPFYNAWALTMPQGLFGLVLVSRHPFYHQEKVKLLGCGHSCCCPP